MPIIPQVKKVWIYGAATAIIIASTSTMAYALNTNIPASVSAKVVSSAAAPKADNQAQAAGSEITTEYKVVDLSKGFPSQEQEKALKNKLSLIKGITPEQIEEKYQAIVAAAIPGAKDISAEQAAADAAAILKKVYGVDFTGYTAEVSFARNSVPNTDNWGVIFHASNESDDSKRYEASVNSVDGTILDLGCYDLSYREENTQNLQDPSWKTTAEADVAKLMPENVSITGSEVVSATPETGVSIVSKLSDGSAYALRLTGANQEAAAVQYFPNGYDGSWDYHPVTGNGVG